MTKSKRKNSLALQGRADAFTVLWVASYLIACFVSYLVTYAASSMASAWFPYTLLPRIPILLIFLMMSLPAVLQVQFIERLFKRSMRGWMVYSLASAVLTVLLLLIFNPGTYWSIQNIMYDAPLYFMVGTVAQTIWLWPRVSTLRLWPLKLWSHVSPAWLWPLVGVVMVFVPSINLRATPGNEIFILIWAVLNGLLQGCVMHYLLSHSRGSEKAKVDFAAEEDLDHERFEHLQEYETPNPLWDIGDEQALQADTNV